jgi:23S rRNA U2552 (ribose-2'-O)-methylase RlmE/FtsJ
MKKLKEIYLKYSYPEGHGDKGTAHSYIDIYSEILSEYRNNSTVLEIGLSHGESLLMWEEYFLNSMVYGVDITDEHLKHYINENHNIIIHDATKESFLNIIEKIYFDVIIDDGSHLIDDQINSFVLLKKKMNKGGVYIIEDVVDLDNLLPYFKSLHNNIEIIDNRQIKGRHDDVLIIFKF